MTIRRTLTRALVAALALVIAAPFAPSLVTERPEAQALLQDGGKNGQKKDNSDNDKNKSGSDGCETKGSGKNAQKAEDDKGTPRGVDCPPPEPVPEQVSLANLVPPAPAAVDAELRAALTQVGFIDTWYDTTSTHPALSLLTVSSAQADSSRQNLLNLLDDIVRTTKRSTSLYAASEEAVLERRAVVDDIGIVEQEIVALEADLDAAELVLAGLRDDLALVIRALQETAVGMYVSDEPAGVAAMDDVVNYNDQQELSIRVELTLDELFAQRDALEAAIASQERTIEDLEAAIAATEARLAALEGRRQNLSETIGRLTETVGDLTLHRFEVEESIPDAIAQTHQARLLATAPGLEVSLVTLDAYVRAAEDVRRWHPDCAIRWQLIAGIASIESAHATFGGAWVAADGQVSGRRIIGPLLDGTLEDTAVIKDTDGGALDGNKKFDAAVGPFQFIPGTWKGYRLDATGDGFADPHNLYDAALSAAGYLCTTSRLADDAGIRRSVLSYNASMKYVADVTGNAKSYILNLALPEPAYDPDAVEVELGWNIQLREPDNFAKLGQLGRVGTEPDPLVVNTSGLLDDGS